MVAAARRPIEGADRVGALLGSLVKLAGDFEAMPMCLNGGPAARLDLDGELNTVANLVIEDRRITRIYAIRNPQKLARLDEKAELSRVYWLFRVPVGERRAGGRVMRVG